MDEAIRTYKLEVDIQDNGIIRDPFGWIVGRCNDEWFGAVVRHALPERICGNLWQHGFMCTECKTSVSGLNTINYCPTCGAKVVK